MELSVEEVARYLPGGARALTDPLRARIVELVAAAPLRPASAARRVGMRYYLCGTVGAAFDAYLRRLALASAADALVGQALGTAAVEKVMDTLEEEIRRALPAGERLLPRRSPGYGEMPLAFSREILDRLDAQKRLGVTLTEANLLVPSKSVTALAEIIREAR